MIIRRTYKPTEPDQCLLCRARKLKSEQPLCSLCGTMAAVVSRPWFEAQEYAGIIDEPFDSVKREPGTELWSDEDREMLKAMGIKA